MSAGISSDFIISTDLSGVTTITDLGTSGLAQGTDTLENVEILRFLGDGEEVML